MKFIKIFPHKVGLVFRKGNYIRTLTKGSHWLGWNETVKIYDKTQAFTAPCELNILLADPVFAAQVEVIEVKDTEIALQFLNGNFKQVLTPGRYAIWKDVVEYSHRLVDLNEVEVPADIERKVLLRPGLIIYIKIQEVASFEEGLLFVDGKYVRHLTSGTYYFWKSDKNVKVEKTDLRQRMLEISGQEILTKDKAAIRINFFAQFKVVDVVKALAETNDVFKQLYIALQLAIREYVGTLTLDDLLAKKEDITAFVLEGVAEEAAEMGVEVTGGGIRDIILPGDVKEIMNKVLIAEKQAQANIITRREETASTRSLLNTAKLMEDNEMLFKLKEMEYVEKIADKINSISLSGGSQVVDQLREIFVKN